MTLARYYASNPAGELVIIAGFRGRPVTKKGVPYPLIFPSQTAV